MLVFAVLVLVWGTTWGAIRVGLNGLPPFTAVAIRFAIATVILLALARLRGVPLGREPHEKTLWIVNGLLFFSVSYGVVYWSEQYVPSGVASILFATFPLMVTLLAHWMLPGEPLRPRMAFGGLAAFLGVVVIFSEDLARIGGPRAYFAAGIFLLSPIVSSISSVLVKRWGTGIHPISLAVVPMAIAAGVMTVLALVFERGQPLRLNAPTVASLLYLALAGSALTFTLYYWLLRHVPAGRVALMAYMTPVVAVSTGVRVLHEPFTARFAIGGLLVIAGVAVAAAPKPARVET